MSEVIPQNRDHEHLRLLYMFHYICAGIMAVLASFPIVHLIIGMFWAFAPSALPGGAAPPPPLVGWVFIFVATFMIVIGWTTAGLLAWAGRCIDRRIHHTFCIVMAAIECMFMPFGTVLGVFTIIVLVRPSVRLLFNQPATA